MERHGWVGVSDAVAEDLRLNSRVERQRGVGVPDVVQSDPAHADPVLETSKSIDKCVRREIHEETGLDVRVDRLTGVYKNLSRGVVALVFKCSYVAGIPYATTESQQVRWVSPALVGQIMKPAYAIRVMDALRPSGEVQIRAHDSVHLLDTTGA